MVEYHLSDVYQKAWGASRWNFYFQSGDGTPLAWFGHAIGCRRVRRIAGMDWMTAFFRAEEPYRHFLLGDTEETIRKVMERARRESPGIRIAGHSPPFKEFTDAVGLGEYRDLEARYLPQERRTQKYDAAARVKS